MQDGRDQSFYICTLVLPVAICVDDDIRTLMLGLGQNSSRLTEYSWFF